MAGINDVKVKIDQDEVVEGQEVLDQFKCVICLSIPIDPRECGTCNNFVCTACLRDYEHGIFAPYEGTKCPVCKEKADFRPINKNLKKLFVMKLRFRHVCKRRSQDELTPLEKFKLTPEYQAIKDKHGQQFTKKRDAKAEEKAS